MVGQRGGAGSAAAPQSFHSDGEDEPGTAHADRMTQRRWRAA
jgi:hypothetical protein